MPFVKSPAVIQIPRQSVIQSLLWSFKSNISHSLYSLKNKRMSFSFTICNRKILKKIHFLFQKILIRMFREDCLKSRFLLKKRSMTLIKLVKLKTKMSSIQSITEQD